MLPEFQSPLGHMRAKAAWVAGQYADITFNNPINFMTLLNCIVAGLRDSELPVRYKIRNSSRIWENEIEILPRNTSFLILLAYIVVFRSGLAAHFKYAFT